MSDPTPSHDTLTLSKGHVCFLEPTEYNPQRYEVYVGMDGHLYKAPVSNAIDIWGYRQGRWEAPPHLIERRVAELKKYWSTKYE